ncbi:MAG: hypothetical protein KIT84_30965 [Labilithrix sp.]|nr:hypothetical protein [Labilithrix sp.]MCW5815490.1 hypothetical protein [Labilithrix sp.]
MSRTASRLAKLLVSGVLLAGAGALLTGGATSCAATPDRSRATFILLPDYIAYRDNVDPYLQRRCGTLDCHGQPGRAYRLYGFSGFRLYNEDAGLVSGQQPTTEAEITANFQATVALEPEEMSRLIARQGVDPEKLIFLRKPLRLERHKGGRSMEIDDPGYRCVTAWLRLRTVRAAQDETGEIETIPPEDREPFPLRARQECALAASIP